MTKTPEPKRVFLSAEWRDLVMLNYEVEARLLHLLVPAGTALDSFEGKTYVSLVGFRFCSTKLFGRFPLPFHSNFVEVNLRFYVRRKDDHEDRRGVVFIAEVVSRYAIAKTARLVYGENYRCLRMKHQVTTSDLNKTLQYQWQAGSSQAGSKWCTLSAETMGIPTRPAEGGLEQFITEHYWGYSAQRSGGCVEYHVSHVPWQVWETSNARFEGEASTLYGKELAAVLQRHPDSAFVADGSPVIVFKGNKIP